MVKARVQKLTSEQKHIKKLVGHRANMGARAYPQTRYKNVFYRGQKISYHQSANGRTSEVTFWINGQIHNARNLTGAQRDIDNYLSAKGTPKFKGKGKK